MNWAEQKTILKILKYGKMLQSYDKQHVKKILSKFIFLYARNYYFKESFFTVMK